MMPKNKYKLQPVLDVRDRAKQEASRVVAARRAKVAEAEAELARREQSLADCHAQQETAQAKMMQEIGSGAEAHQVVTHRTHLADLRRVEEELKQQIEQQKQVVARADSELETSLAALIEASKELRVIEKHREGWSERTRLEGQRREQKLSDEIGSIIHGRKSED
jgi:flagellar export protein FliJ